MYLVFDVGGTNLRCGLYDPADRVLIRKLQLPTPSHWSIPEAAAADLQAQLFRLMTEMAQELLGRILPTSVCVAFPGPVNRCGRVLMTPTLWRGGESEPLLTLSEFKRIWPSVAVHLVNDVTAAGYRYLTHISGDFCIVTVSSGIGHKIFVGNQEIVGSGGRGGEIGHWAIDTSSNAPLCDCGERGHVSAFASGRGAIVMARRRAADAPSAFARSSLWDMTNGDPELLETEHLVASFINDDPWTVQLITDVVQPLGRVIGAIHLTAGLERFIIIGGFALALGENYRRLLAVSARSSCISLGQNWDSMIEMGFLDDDSGLIGAGIYLEKTNGRIRFDAQNARAA